MVVLRGELLIAIPEVQGNFLINLQRFQSSLISLVHIILENSCKNDSN